jgi:hypothetical protein
VDAVKQIPTWLNVVIVVGMILFAAGWATREFGSPGKYNDSWALKLAGAMLVAYAIGWLHAKGVWSTKSA